MPDSSHNARKAASRGDSPSSTEAPYSMTSPALGIRVSACPSTTVRRVTTSDSPSRGWGDRDGDRADAPDDGRRDARALPHADTAHRAQPDVERSSLSTDAIWISLRPRIIASSTSPSIIATARLALSRLSPVLTSPST